MTVVGASEARMRFAALLARASKGEKITITRHGIPVAMLVPIVETKAKLTHKEIVEGMRELRRRTKSGKAGVRKMVTQGRRF